MQMRTHYFRGHTERKGERKRGGGRREGEGGRVRGGGRREGEEGKNSEKG